MLFDASTVRPPVFLAHPRKFYAVVIFHVRTTVLFLVFRDFGSGQRCRFVNSNYFPSVIFKQAFIPYNPNNHCQFITTVGAGGARTFLLFFSGCGRTVSLCQACLKWKSGMRTNFCSTGLNRIRRVLDGHRVTVLRFHSAIRAISLRLSEEP